MFDEPAPLFGALDRDREIDVSRRHLPHWFQAGASIFVTFRMADSLPKQVLLRMRRQLEEWLLRRQLPPALAAPSLKPDRMNSMQQLLCTLSRRDRNEYLRLVARIHDMALDECHGSCVLRDPEFAQIVAEILWHDDGQKFDLDRFVIMPNHVHVLVQFRAGYDLGLVSQSWMRYSARLLNAKRYMNGAFWQSEPYDHLVRSEQHFRWLQNYIAQNPVRARLAMGEFLFWTRDVRGAIEDNWPT